MKISIPTNDSLGFGATLSDHFGRAPFVMTFDTESGSIDVRPNGHGDHGHDNCRNTAAGIGLGSDLIICRNIGRRALAALERIGIPVAMTDEVTLAGALEAYRQQRLNRPDRQSVCAGHGEGP